jgi:hypothetical protein
MKPGWTVVLLLLIAGCGSINEASGSLGSRPKPSPGAKPAVKKELPWLTVPGGRMRTTLFYGPWQCRQQFMNECRMKCASEGHVLKGCMWLADLKFDWEGSLFLLPVNVEAGSRYGIYHCCCDYTELSKQATRVERDKWENRRNTFRQEWSKRFGNWPEETGKAWPGHHVRDLKHGGDPIDANNVFPAMPSVHDVYTREYPGCYDGKAPWNTVGADLPYTDN